MGCPRSVAKTWLASTLGVWIENVQECRAKVEQILGHPGTQGAPEPRFVNDGNARRSGRVASSTGIGYWTTTRCSGDSLALHRRSERGEFHSFAYDGRTFDHAVPIRTGELVKRGGFAHADILSAEIKPQVPETWYRCREGGAWLVFVRVVNVSRRVVTSYPIAPVRPMVVGSGQRFP